MPRHRRKFTAIPEITTIFEEAQYRDKTPHSQLLPKLSRIFRTVSLNEFTSNFVTCLSLAFVSSSESNSGVDQIIKFTTKFLISVCELNTSSEDDELPEEAMQLLFDVFEFLNNSCRVTNVLVRKRVCSMVAKFFENLNADAVLDVKLCDIVINIMKERIKDKVPIVRMQAILALFRLQDKSDKNCPVRKLLINVVETDTNGDVRKLALSKVSVWHKSDVKLIMDRINDISEKVRAEAYTVFSKLHIKQLSIKQRRRLLDTGLYDNNDDVKKIVKTVLLPSWLKRMDGDYLNFLNTLDLSLETMSLMTKTLMWLFECSTYEPEPVLRSHLDESTSVILYNKLTSESAFFWRCYVYFVSDKVHEKNDFLWDAGASYDATEQRLLPDLSIFCEYIQTYYNSQLDDSPDEELWQKREKEFILIQLIELCKVYDYSDEVGRKKLRTLCINLLKKVEIRSIRPVVELFFMLKTNLNDNIGELVELINDILHPAIDQPANENIKDKTLELTRSDQLDSTVEAMDQNFKFKMAQLEVKLDEVKDAQEEAVRNEDYSKAEQLKQQVLQIRAKIDKLKDEFYEKRASVTQNLTIVDADADFVDDEDSICNPLENVSVDVVKRCITILSEMMHLAFVKHVTPLLRSQLQVLVLPACKSNDPLIAPLATEVLGSFCLRDKELAKEYFTTFFALCSNGDICVSALKVIFDCLLIFGPNAFNISNLNDYEGSVHQSDSAEDSGTAKQEGMISGYTFVSALVDLLDDEFSEARLIVVHGLCKLMATGKLKSVKVLTRLIVMWFHPSSQESVEIRDCLNFFFPFLVKKCPWSVSLFENAFVPTMETFFNAPSHNPLSQVDQKLVMKALCDIISPQFTDNCVENGDNSRFNLAVTLCNTIIDANDLTHQATLLKGLNYLDLSRSDVSALTTLSNLLNKIMKKFKKKNQKKLAFEAERIKAKIDLLIEDERNAHANVNQSPAYSEQIRDDAKYD